MKIISTSISFLLRNIRKIWVGIKNPMLWFYIFLSQQIIQDLVTRYFLDDVEITTLLLDLRTTINNLYDNQFVRILFVFAAFTLAYRAGNRAEIKQEDEAEKTREHVDKIATMVSAPINKKLEELSAIISANHNYFSSKEQITRIAKLLETLTLHDERITNAISTLKLDGDEDEKERSEDNLRMAIIDWDLRVLERSDLEMLVGTAFYTERLNSIAGRHLADFHDHNFEKYKDSIQSDKCKLINFRSEIIHAKLGELLVGYKKNIKVSENKLKSGN